MSMNKPETAGTDDTERAQDVLKTFTAEDYEEEARKWLAVHWGTCPPPYVILSALRIAANVMRPGFMEKLVEDYYGYPSVIIDKEAAAIRKALLGEAEPGNFLMIKFQ